MGLESASFINDLVTTNPLGTDTIPQGDDHLRLLKTVLKASFPDSSRAYYLPKTTSSQTSTVTVAIADQNKLFPVDASGGAITVDLPQGSTLVDGYEVTIVKTDHTTNQVLWQSYQSAVLRYSSSLSAWIMNRQYIPPKGEVTPWVGASAIAQGGFLFLNGQTIGHASSAATNANAIYEGLYKLLWTEFSNTVCAVSTGRGATAAADWSAFKTLAIPNLCGDTWVGLDNMGAVSDVGRLTATANGANTAGQTNGEQIGSESATVSVARLPVASLSHSLSVSTTLSNGTNVFRGSFAAINCDANEPESTAIASSGVSPETLSLSSGAVAGTVTLGGSGDGTPVVQPSFVSAWKIKI
jgi:hypothetical protein